MPSHNDKKENGIQSGRVVLGDHDREQGKEKSDLKAATCRQSIYQATKSFKKVR